MRRLVRIVFLVLIVLGLGYYIYSEDLNNADQARDTSLEKEVAQVAEQEVVAPPPLRGPVEEVDPANLTMAGTVAETNFHRRQNGLLELSTSEQLIEAAEMKADDMFSRQYFAHDSPTGEGPGDLATAAGYDYLSVGENLALGNYESDEVLVEAWMNSPGHRDNILNSKYTEIGVAVKKGTYEGRTVWMAVQEFGRPASLCPEPIESLSFQIEENQLLLKELEKELDDKSREISRMRPKRGAAYNQKVDEYNELVSRYNVLIEETKALISEYNEQVRSYNICIQ